MYIFNLPYPVSNPELNLLASYLIGLRQEDQIPVLKAYTIRVFSTVFILQEQ